ncbi:MAG TPA: tetratricopeptide repeat protein [Bryobacteraceae bacterium]|nr:tetratricopeptide repeat protein [Bryobacteraceae bacterium]
MGLNSRLLVLCAGALLLAQRPAVSPDRLAAVRNLGKAFYENPTTHREAVAEFRKAMALNPGAARDRLNYGLALLRAGSMAEGMAELEAVQKQDPKLPHTWFNLGIQWKKQGETEKAVAQLRRFAELAPDDPPGHYNLGVLLKQSGDTAAAIAAFRRTIELDGRLFGPHFQLFNLFRQAGRAEEARAELEQFQKWKKAREGDPIPEDLEWSWYSEILDEPEPVAAASAVKASFVDLATDYALDPATAHLAVTKDGVLAGSKAGFALVGQDGKVRWRVDAPAYAAAAGDANNDGQLDFAVLSPAGVSLYMGGALERPIVLDKGRYTAALWIDYDHDYDQDLLLLGETCRLLRNEGDNGFQPRPFPFAPGQANRAYLLRVEPDSKALDLLIGYADGSRVLYRDALGGQYKAGPVERLPLAPPFDLRNRGFYDWTGAFYTAGDWNGDGILEPVEAVAAAADIDGDGRLDQWALDAKGALLRRRNTTPWTNWITVKLEGVKNAKLAFGAEVEVKAGSLYQKRFYMGVPLAFSLGAHAQADTVRITWPNGLIQNEVRQPGRKAYNYQEAQRLSGSCPHIWTWNGRQFQYVTDVLGVAPLGASSGDGQYFPTDHDEYIQIPAGALAAKDGKYEIRISEELAEVAYLDQVQLLAVDHAADESLFVSDKFKAPPFPAFQLYAARQRIRPERSGNVFTFPGAIPAKALLVLTGWVDWADGSFFVQGAQTRGQQLQFPRLEAKNAQGEWVTVVEDMGLPAGKPKSIVVPVADLPSGTLRIVTNLDVHWTDAFLTPDDGEPVHRIHAPKLASAELHFRGFSPVTIDPQRREPERFHYHPALAASLWNPTPGFYTRYGEVEELVDRIDDRLVIMGSGDELILRFDDQLPPVPAGQQRDFLLKVDGWAKDRDPNTAHSQTVEPLPHHRMTTYPYPASESHPGGDWIRQYNTRPALRLVRPLVTRR